MYSENGKWSHFYNLLAITDNNKHIISYYTLNKFSISHKHIIIKVT